VPLLPPVPLPPPLPPAVHCPRSHACPIAQTAPEPHLHVPSPAQVSPRPEQSTQLPPLEPQCVAERDWHVVPAQQPAHEVAVH
jgi:hypothetical protein